MTNLNKDQVLNKVANALNKLQLPHTVLSLIHPDKNIDKKTLDDSLTSLNEAVFIFKRII